MHLPIIDPQFLFHAQSSLCVRPRTSSNEPTYGSQSFVKLPTSDVAVRNFLDHGFTASRPLFFVGVGGADEVADAGEDGRVAGEELGCLAEGRRPGY